MNRRGRKRIGPLIQRWQKVLCALGQFVGNDFGRGQEWKASNLLVTLINGSSFIVNDTYSSNAKN